MTRALATLGILWAAETVAVVAAIAAHLRSDDPADDLRARGYLVLPADELAERVVLL